MNPGIGKRIKHSPVEMTLVQPKDYGWFWRLLLSLAVPVRELLLLALRHPWVSLGVVLLVLLGVKAGWIVAVIAVLVLAGGLTVWWWRFPASYEIWVAVPVRSSWRREWRYRRDWQPAMMLSGLAQRYSGDEYLPRLRRVVSDRYVDRVRVRLVQGQTPADIDAVTDRLAETFRVNSCKVVWERPREVTLICTHADVLAEPIDALPMMLTPDVGALPIGQRENYRPARRWDAVRDVVRGWFGKRDATRAEMVDARAGGGRSWWLLRLLYTHVLIAGATGAGKGSVLWSLLRALDGAIRAGTVRVFAIDPKGGMELAFGARMFAGFVYGDDQTSDEKQKRAYELRFAEFLEERVEEMRRRQARARGVTRRVVPSATEPLDVIVVDELASLTEYVLDRDAKKRIAAALSLLLSQGRAVAISVVAAVQDPRKETVPFRDLFPTRIALRMTEGEQADLVLGKGAHDRGAHCELIPESTPGVGYVVLEGVREPVRVRAGHVTDEDIHDQAQFHPTGQPIAAAVDLPYDEAA